MCITLPWRRFTTSTHWLLATFSFQWVKEEIVQSSYETNIYKIVPRSAWGNFGLEMSGRNNLILLSVLTVITKILYQGLVIEKAFEIKTLRRQCCKKVKIVEWIIPPIMAWVHLNYIPLWVWVMLVKICHYLPNIGLDINSLNYWVISYQISHQQCEFGKFYTILITFCPTI